MEGIRTVDLPKILDYRGNLSFLENHAHVPFSIARTYWIYDVPGGGVRGGHAYKKGHEFIIALSGSFDIVIYDGMQTKIISLNRSYTGLYISNMMWRHLENFSTNSLALFLSDRPYDAADYIRDKDAFHIAKTTANAAE